MKTHPKDLLLIEQLDNANTVLTENASDIVKFLDTYVIGQEKAKKALSVAYINHVAKTSFNKNPMNEFKIGSNVLLIVGASGSGKTHLVRTLARHTDLLLSVEDASQFSSSGYVGRSVSDMLVSLVQKAGGDIAKAEKGIIFIDEVDKLGDFYTTAEVRGKAIQSELLTMIEGNILELEPPSRGEMAGFAGKKIDTSKILFILGGAFTPLIEKKKAVTVGLKTKSETKEEDDNIAFQPHELIDFGFMREFIGRITGITRVKDLTEVELKQIFIEPVDALIKQYRALFKVRGVNYEITEEDIDYIVEEAFKLKIGARGLKQVAEPYFIERTFN